MATRRNKGEKMENVDQVEQVEQTEQVEQEQPQVEALPDLEVKPASYSQPLEFKPQRVTTIGEMTRKDW